MLATCVVWKPSFALWLFTTNTNGVPGGNVEAMRPASVAVFSCCGVRYSFCRFHDHIVAPTSTVSTTTVTAHATRRSCAARSCHSATAPRAASIGSAKANVTTRSGGYQPVSMPTGTPSNVIARPRHQEPAGEAAGQRDAHGRQRQQHVERVPAHVHAQAGAVQVRERGGEARAAKEGVFGRRDGEPRGAQHHRQHPDPGQHGPAAQGRHDPPGVRAPPPLAIAQPRPHGDDDQDPRPHHEELRVQEPAPAQQAGRGEGAARAADGERRARGEERQREGQVGQVAGREMGGEDPGEAARQHPPPPPARRPSAHQRHDGHADQHGERVLQSRDRRRQRQTERPGERGDEGRDAGTVAHERDAERGAHARPPHVDGEVRAHREAPPVGELGVQEDHDHGARQPRDPGEVGAGTGSVLRVRPYPAGVTMRFVCIIGLPSVGDCTPAPTSWPRPRRSRRGVRTPPASIAPCWIASSPRRCCGRRGGAAGRSPSSSSRSARPPPSGWTTARSRSSRPASTAGAGVRVAHGTSYGYAYSNRLDRDALLEAAAAASAALRDGDGGAVVDLTELARSRHEPRRASARRVPAADKVAWLREVERRGARVQPRGRAGRRRLRRLAAAPADRHVGRPLGAGGPPADPRRGAGGGEARTTTSRPASTGRPRAPAWSSWIAPRRAAPPRSRPAAPSRCSTASPAPAGEMTVVLAPGMGGVLFHEAVGHPLESDAVDKEASVYRGLVGERVRQRADQRRRRRHGRPTDGARSTSTTRRAPAQRTVLFTDGVLQGFLYDRLRADKDGVPSSGNGRRESYAHPPVPRMTNTYILNGASKPDDILSSTARGRVRDVARRRPGEPGHRRLRVRRQRGLPDRGRAGGRAGARREPHRPRHRGHERGRRRRRRLRHVGGRLRQGRPGRARGQRLAHPADQPASRWEAPVPDLDDARAGRRGGGATTTRRSRPTPRSRVRPRRAPCAARSRA